MMSRCFVMQPFDNADFDRRYEEIYEPAIVSAGFEPYRVDRDPGASIPIQTIENEIRSSAACFIDISVDNPNVWFEFGFAISAGKPVCIVSSKVRTRLPFDVQHRKMIFYDTRTRSDFDVLHDAIKSRLSSILEKEIKLEPSPVQIESDDREIALSHVEFQTLCVVFEHCGDGNADPHFSDIQNGMDRIGLNRLAARVGLTSLTQKGFVMINDFDKSNIRYFITGERKKYALEHIDQMSLIADPSF